MAEIYYGNYVLLGYAANWKTRPKATLRMLTNSREANIGSELRGSSWAMYRRVQEWLVTGRDGEECGRIEETIRVAQVAKKAAAPYWLAARSVSSVNGNVITLDVAPDPAYAPGQIMWFGGLRSSAYGLAIVLGASGRELTLAAVPEGLSAGVQCAPVLLGILDGDPSVKEVHGASRSWTLALAQTMGDLAGQIRTEEESATMGISISGNLIDMTPVRASAAASVIGISISGNLVT
ncbi:MAG: hypothetical protein WC378_19885, partial [Opitutaceae bacterium]